MNIQEWKQLCRKALESEYDSSKIDRLAKTGDGRNIITNCNETIYIESTRETKPIELLCINMIYSIENKDELKDIEARLVEKLGKQGFHYDARELFEPITKTVTHSNPKLLEETKSTEKAFESLDETSVHLKGLELMNKNGVID